MISSDPPSALKKVFGTEPVKMFIYIIAVYPDPSVRITALLRTATLYASWLALLNVIFFAIAALDGKRCKRIMCKEGRDRAQYGIEHPVYIPDAGAHK